MVIAQQTTNIRSQGLAGLQQRRKADIRQRQIAEQERSNELEQRRIAEELRTPEQRALQELQSIQAPAEGQRLFDRYGGVVVTFDENVLGLAKATGISPRVAYGLVESGQLSIRDGNIVYKGTNLGSSEQAEQEALRIVTARGQTGTTDSYTTISTASKVQRIAESNKDLRAGEVLDIAREAKILPTISGAKPQLEFTKKDNILSYQRITKPIVEQEGFLKPALEINPATGREYGVVSPSLNFGQRFKESIGKQGIIKGTISFLTNEAIVRPADRFSSFAIKNIPGYIPVFSGDTSQAITKDVLPNAIYFTPAGPALLFSQGVEELATPSGKARIKANVQSYQESGKDVFTSNLLGYGVPILETTLGAIGLKAQLFSKPNILAPPKKLEVFTTSESRSAMTIENIPRAKIVKNIEGEVIGVGTSRGGTQTIVRPIETPTSTLIEGKNWLQVQKSIGDKAEGVIFIKNKPGVAGDYAVTYTSQGGRTNYNIYQQTSKGLRKVDNQKVDISEDIFKFTEPIQKSKTKVQSVRNTPDLFKIRTIKEKRVLEQELVKTGKSKYNILEEKGLQTKIVRKKVTETGPAEIKGKLGIQFFEPKPVTETGEIIETAQVNLIKKLKPKFARAQPPDVEEIKGLIAKENSKSLGTLEGRTPRFKDMDITKQTIEGQYTLYAPSRAERLARALVPSSKKGQGTILELQENKLLSFKDIQKVSVPKVSEYIPSTSEISFSIPTITSESKGALNLGAVSLLKVSPKISQEVNQQMDILKDVHTISKSVPINKIGLQQEMKLETKSIQELKQKLNQLQKQEFKFQEQKLLETRTPRPSRPEPRTPKKPKPFKFEIDIPSKSAKSKIKEVAGELFSIFKRQKGRDVFVGKERTEYLAGERLKRELKRDTSASGFVERLGEKVKASSFGDFNFRVGKSDPFKLVQRKGGKEGGAGRLSTRSEVYDIFRQKKNKRNKWFD